MEDRRTTDCWVGNGLGVSISVSGRWRMKVGLFPGQGVQPSIVLETLSSRHKLLKRVRVEILEMDLRRRVEIAARGSAAALPTWLAQPAIFVASVIGLGSCSTCRRSVLRRPQPRRVCGPHRGRRYRLRPGITDGQIPEASPCRTPAGESLEGWPRCWASASATSRRSPSKPACRSRNRQRPRPGRPLRPRCRVDQGRRNGCGRGGPVGPP